MSILKVTKFINGPLILSSKSDSDPYINAYIKTRPRKKDVPGAAHFLEHIILSGKNQCGYTTREYTSFSFRNVNIPDAVRYVTRPDFGAKTFEYEQERILREKNSNFERLIDEAHANSLGADNILGSPERIAIGDLVDFHKAHYIPKNFIFHVTGPQSHQRVLKEFKKHLNLGRTTRTIRHTFVPSINLMIKDTCDFFVGSLRKLNEDFAYIRSVGHKDIRFMSLLRYLNDLKKRLEGMVISVLYFPYASKGVLCFSK